MIGKPRKKRAEIGVIRTDKKPIVARFSVPKYDIENFKMKFDKEDDKTTIYAQSNSVRFQGKIKKKDADTYIVVRKHNSDKVLLVPVNYVNLKRYFEDQIRPTESVSTSELYKTFGSKKAKRDTEQQERMKLNFENTKDELEETVIDVNVEDNSAPVEESLQSVVTPPINKKATNAGELYNLEDLITTEELSLLEDHATGLIDGTYTEETDMCLFTKTLFDNLPESSEKLRNIEVLIFVEYTIKFLKENVKKISLKGYKAYPYSSQINDKILGLFSTVAGRGRSRSIMMRDKALCYILVLCLLINNLELDLELFSLSFPGVGIKKVLEIARVLGAVPKDKKSTVIKLQYPIPTSSGYRMKKRKR